MGFAGHILGCADTTGLNINDAGLDFGVLTPGCNYILKEIKSNDSFFLNKSEFPFRIPDDPEAPKYVYPDDGSAACYFPIKDGGDAVADKEILSAKDAYEDYSKNKDDSSKWKLDYNKITLFENEAGDNDNSDGIDIDNTDDGIDVQDPDSDGIDIDNSDDGISIDGISVGDTVDGITIDNITKSGDGIIIESTDESGDTSITLDPWGGEIPENAISVPTIHELSVDIRSIHGMVELTPVSGVNDNQSKYIRLVESDSGYDVIVMNDVGDTIYEAPYDAAVGVAWSEFLSKDAVYTVTAIADDGYVVTDYSIVNSVNQGEVIEFNDFESGVYQSYSWDVSLKDNKDVVINFGSADGIDVVDTDDMSYDLADTSDALAYVEMTDDSAIEVSDESDSSEDTKTILLESEKNTLGYENVEIISSMADDVEVPEITKSDCKEAIADPVYEGYVG